MSQDHRPTDALLMAWAALTEALEADQDALRSAGLTVPPQTAEDWRALAAFIQTASAKPALTTPLDLGETALDGASLDLTRDAMAGEQAGDNPTVIPLDLSQFDFDDTSPVENTDAGPTAQENAAVDSSIGARQITKDEAIQVEQGDGTMANRILPPEITASLDAAKDTDGPREIDGRLDRAAIQNEPFEGRLTDPTGVEVELVEGLDGSGLSFDPAAGTFVGTAEAPGTLKAVLIGTKDGAPVRVNVRIPVSPDPWSLWKDHPVDPNLPFQKPDRISQRVEGDLVLLLASQRGRSHAHKALPRDDDAVVLHDAESGWHIGAVADGAGSAPLSREGSRLAVTAVAETLPGLLADTDATAIAADPPASDMRERLHTALNAAARAAADSIDQAAATHDEPRQAFSTTLIMGAAKRVGDQWLLVSFTVGDGLIGVYGPGIENPLMMNADSGAYAGQTVFLARSVLDDPAARGRMVVRTASAFTAFAMMTDGVSDPMFASDHAMDDLAAWDTFWTDNLAPLNLSPTDDAAAERMLDWLSFKKRGEHDDRTIVLMLPRAGTEAEGDA